GFAEQEGLGVELGLGPFLQFRQDGGLGGFEYAVEPAEHGERQDDPAVLGLFVIAAQQIGDGPDEGGEVRVGHGDGVLNGADCCAIRQQARQRASVEGTEKETPPRYADRATRRVVYPKGEGLTCGTMTTACHAGGWADPGVRQYSLVKD